MKRLLIILAGIFLGGTLTLSGQFIKSMGLKAGISLANQSHRIDDIDYTFETQPIAGPAVVLYTEFFRRRHLGIEVDIAYIARGSKTTTRSVTVNHLDNDRIIVNEGNLSTSRYHYISLSPLVIYRIGEGRLTPYLLLGPRFEYLLKYETDSEYPIDDQNSYMMGLSGGAGVEFNISRLGVMAEVQFQPDLSPVTNQDPLMINNNCLLFTVGIRYLKSQ